MRRNPMHSEKLPTMSNKVAECTVLHRFRFLLSGENEIDCDLSSYIAANVNISWYDFCDERGPKSLEATCKCASMLENYLKMSSKDITMKIARDSNQPFDRSVFLAGSYMILKLDVNPELIADRLSIFLPQINISPGDEGFSLHIFDLWDGIYRAKELKWIDIEPAARNTRGIDSPPWQDRRAARSSGPCTGKYDSAKFVA